MHMGRANCAAYRMLLKDKKRKMKEFDFTSPSGQPGFWQGGFGLFIRWISFIPVSAILTGLIEFLVVLFFNWLFMSGLASLAKTLIIVIIIFGGSGILVAIPFIVMAYYGSIILGNKLICPKPRVGVIIYGTLYALNCFQHTVGIFRSNGGLALIIVLLIMKLVFTITVIVGLVSSYTESE